MSICALFGETLIEKGFHWEMALSDDLETWNLFLKNRHEQFAFFVDIYKDIFVNNEIEDVLSLNFCSMVSE